MSKAAMEVVRAAAKATVVLDTVLGIIPEAIELHRGHAERLQSYEREIRKATATIGLIRGQKGLQTSGVVAGIRMLQSQGEIIDNDRELKQILELFKSKRKGLVQQIRIASPGLAKPDGAIVVDTKVVETTNEAVKKVPGIESGLVIALFLAKLNRGPDAKGHILLTSREYEDLTWLQIKTAHPETKTVTQEAKTRILCNCLARDQSIQILGPVAEDLWSGIAFIKIEGLVSTDEAVQFGYAVTLDVFRETLDRQDKRIASSRTKELRK